ncbi:MAG: ferritin family protein [Desulfuromonadales bacterium]|nr:ferritin family protein [Desulfuromonadales bacterium]
MSIFAASDVLQFAVRMEENGGLFYTKAAELSGNSEAKKLFGFLASEEAEHKKTFEKFLSQVTLYEPPEEYPGEYLSYLHNYIDGKVFFTNDASMTKTIDVASALEFAIQREMDAILYYSELKAFVNADDQKPLDAIIDEERKHFAQLSEIRKNL